MGFRDKADDVYRQGEMERGRFNPTGAPLRVYQYWHARAEYPPKRENFCHFWRVVVFWAPLMFIRRPIARAVKKVLPQGSTVQKIVYAIARGIAKPFIFADNQIKRIPENIQEKIAIAFLGLLGILALTVVVALFVAAVIDFGLWTTLLGIAGGIGTFAILIGLSFAFTTFIENRREKRMEKEAEFHDAYLNGEISEEEYINTKTSSIIPQAVKNFFRGIGDFLILAFNIVRVKKWKICPIVEIPKDEVDTAQPVV